MALLQYVLLVLVLVFACLYKGSHVFRFYVKWGYFILVYVVASIWIIPVALFQPFDCVNMGYVHKWWLNVMFPLIGFKIEGRNTAIVKNCKEPAIIMGNHQSNMDTIISSYISPPRTTYLVKKELSYAGTFGLACWLSGLIFVDRLNPEKSRATMEKTAKIIRDKQVRVFVFPEGTRSMKDDLLPFRKGVFHLAIQAQVPIYPVVISSYSHFMDTKRKILNSGRVLVSCLPPVHTQGLTADDVTELTNTVRDKMAAEFIKITEEVRTDAELRGESILEK